MVINKYLAEFVGTFVLVFFGTMTILAAITSGAPVLLAVPFGFGLALLAGIYGVGHVSGAHFNPAVSLGAFLDRRLSFSDLIGYWVGQIAGGTFASLMVWWAFDRQSVADTATSFTNQTLAILLEIVLTAIFVLVILVSTKTSGRAAPVAISLTLVAVHFVGIPFTGASVNPARSFGPAVIGGVPSQLWVYLVAPLIGGVVAWLLYRLFPAGDEA